MLNLVLWEFWNFVSVLWSLELLIFFYWTLAFFVFHRTVPLYKVTIELNNWFATFYILKFLLILVDLVKNWYEFCRYKTCNAALQVQICQPKSLFVQHASLMYIVQILLGAFWRACLFCCFCVCKKYKV